MLFRSLFSEFADVSLPNDQLKKNRHYRSLLESAKIVFCRSEKLKQIFDEDGQYLNPDVVICGNSDYEFHNLDSSIRNKSRYFFLQNSFISDNKKVFTLPIGLENYRLGVNGNPKNIKNIRSFNNKESRILVGPFAPTHKVREQVWKQSWSEFAEFVVVRKRVSPAKLNSLTGQFQFV